MKLSLLFLLLVTFIYKSYAQEELSLEDLLNVEITSASNKKEKLSEAPATVIVLQKKDLQSRGYLELSEVLEDLPGMDVTKSFGDTYFKNCWRGYRNDIGSSGSVNKLV